MANIFVGDESNIIINPAILKAFFFGFAAKCVALEF